MLKPTSILGRFLDRLQSRFTRSRPGSVMILVVTLLVLMALIGTAYISTARTDRAVARMFTANTQIDMFKQGVQQMIFGSLAHNTFLNNNGQQVDDVQTDPWMASRIPTTVGEACGQWQGNSRNYAAGEWAFQSGKFYVCKFGLLANAANKAPDQDSGNNGNWYSVSDDPFLDTRTGNTGVMGGTLNAGTPCWPAVSSPLIPGLQALDLSNLANPLYTASRNVVIPDFIGNLPALWVYDFNSGKMIKVLAASASGDGIADSLIWPLHSGEVNGLEYFAAYRVIDGSSALNLNTGGSAYFDYDGSGNPYTPTAAGVYINDAIFPSNVGLVDLFPSADMTGGKDSVTQGRDYLGLNLYRHISQQSLSADTLAAAQMAYTSAPRPDGIAGGSGVPIGDFGGAHPRGDFLYRTEADALFHGLGRRIETPGFSATFSGRLQQFGSFGWNDSAALGYHFDMLNGNISTLSARPLVEQLMPESLLFDDVKNKPYQAGAVTLLDSNKPWTTVVDWFNQNYVHEITVGDSLDPAPTNRSHFNRRALLTGRNPTSNLMPLSPFLYAPGGGMGQLQTLSAILQLRSGQPADSMGVPYGLPVPWPDPSLLQAVSQLPPPIPKVSINTADITTLDFFATASIPRPGNQLPPPFQGPSLWFGFYNVMADAMLIPGTHQPATVLDPNTKQQVPAPVSPYYFQFRSALRDPAAIAPATALPSLATAPPHILTMQAMTLIRSLIAAVNASDIRDSDDDVKSMTVTLPMNTANGALLSPFLPSTNGTMQITVYGNERQPFITEVYVNNDTNAPPPAQIPDPTKPVDISDPAHPQPTLRQNPNMQPNLNGYVAVELYNPYDVPLSIAGWTLGILSRETNPAIMPAADKRYPRMHVMPLIDPATTRNYFFPAGTVIPARGFLLLDNCQPTTPPPAVPVIGAATYRPYEAYAGLSDTVGASASVAPAPSILFVPGLEKVLRDNRPPASNAVTQPGGELYLLRPRRADGTPNSRYNEIGTNGLNVDSLDPVDSFDFSGMSLGTFMATAPTVPAFFAWHYVRPNSIFGDLQLRSSWKQVFPGRWDATRPIHEEGVISAAIGWNDQNDPMTGKPTIGDPVAGTPATFDPWIMAPPGWAGGATGGPSTRPSTQPATQPADVPIALGAPDYAGTALSNDFPAIQLNNTGHNMLQGGATLPGLTHGVNKNFVWPGVTQQPGKFPFGGFARTGDVLQVPFIGSYTISITDNSPAAAPEGYYVLEMNSVTRDAALADDLIPNDDGLENIGRFCPLLAGRYLADPTNPPNPINEADPTIAVGLATGSVYDTYGWASHILDCFSAIYSPDQPVFPHVSPSPIDPFTWSTSNTYTDPATGQTSNFMFNNWYWNPLACIYPDPLSGGTPQPSAPEMVPRSPSAGGAAPIDGLININTAPWRVLAAIPWRANDGSFTPAQLAVINEIVAKTIVDYRNQFGPFKSLFELNQMPVPLNPAAPISFQQLNGSITIAGADFNASVGDFTPNIPYPINATILTDNIKADAKERFAAITRISNLVTTRSDTFTVYIQVQGWRGIATSSPELIVQRRLAFIVDRSGYPAAGYPKVMTTIPTD
ncbi:MAG TPA: hypothetical protein VH370_26915 [Humisphaera sp.]|jgi:hypothetical protein|nr:hypothetical protein [Humisphaera sp.]